MTSESFGMYWFLGLLMLVIWLPFIGNAYLALCSLFAIAICSLVSLFYFVDLWCQRLIYGKR
jgi:hypothetical protein